MSLEMVNALEALRLEMRASYNLLTVQNADKRVSSQHLDALLVEANSLRRRADDLGAHALRLAGEK